jgi:hypothetical protein
MLVVAVWKKSIAASSSVGEFDTSTTTEAPARTSGRPSPVRVFTPVEGAAATASSPRSVNACTNFDPTRPVPPITTIRMIWAFLDRVERLSSAA